MRLWFFLALAGLSASISTCDKYSTDRRMVEMCRNDGGTFIYEQVILRPEDFDQEGVHFGHYFFNRSIPEEERLGPKYLYREIFEVLKPGDSVGHEAKLTKTTQKIYRRSDGKLLGYSIVYVRSGGEGVFLLGHPSGVICPENSKGLLESVFIKGD